MQSCLTRFLPGFSGRTPGETIEDLRLQNKRLLPGQKVVSVSPVFPGSSGDIKECGSECFTIYYLYKSIGILLHMLLPIDLTILLLLYLEEPEKPEQAPVWGFRAPPCDAPSGSIHAPCCPENRQ
jgi:hypothetical protein